MAASTVILGICRHMHGPEHPAAPPSRACRNRLRVCHRTPLGDSMTRTLSLMVIALRLATSSARATPDVRILPTNDAFHGPCGSSEEDLTLVVSEDGRPIATRPPGDCSSPNIVGDRP